MERRLAAILAADVVGYTALMGADEAGTHRRLTGLRREFLAPLIGAHHGRIVKLMGDGLLVEFASVVDAVACALAWQRGVADRDQELHFRIGINLGDVIVDGDDIHGDGVNIAARLENYAEPGGICLSSDAYRQARGKTDATFEDLGDQALKNVAEPVRVYRVAVSNYNAMPAKHEAEPAPLPDKPSIAVLPFANMSADPEQEFFSDGITEDIITALSKIQNLLVVARNSTLIYKGRAVDVRQVSREQGVRYVLEGSVRKSGNRVRVNAQLIDAKSSHHVWAERFNRDLDDIFAVQDEITREVIVALDVRLRQGEQARFWSSGTENLEAWEFVRLAMDWLGHATPESPNNARELCKKALDLDPNYAMAWVTLGWVYHHGVDVGLGYTSVRDREGGLDSALNCGKRALELDPSCADAFSLLSMCHLSSGEYDQAITMSEQAVALAPSHAEIVAISAMVQNKSGRPERGLELVKRAMRLCPIYPGWYLLVLGMAHRLMGQTGAAIDAFEAGIKREADYLALQVALASTLGEAGRQEMAKKPVSDILRINPGFSIKNYMEGLSYRDSAVLERFEDGLHKVGLPD